MAEFWNPTGIRRCDDLTAPVGAPPVTPTRPLPFTLGLTVAGEVLGVGDG